MSVGQLPEVGVSDLVALVNQTFELAYPAIVVTGELANLRVSKGKWLYFDLKDDHSSVKFFGTVYMLPGPLEDGMLVQVTATPRLHNLYGFSMNVRSIRAAGEGSIKKAAELLQAKLAAEGLFDPERKRPLPYPPKRIGLVASRQSAAYADFIKVVGARWGGVTIQSLDVQVQGEPAIGQIMAAIQQFGGLAEPPDVLVLIRGGGSPEDLAAFSSEQVTRAVAASRIPTLVAIGHEIDISLAELAADQRASTPSNAAELLVPDRRERLQSLHMVRQQLARDAERNLSAAECVLLEQRDHLARLSTQRLQAAHDRLQLHRQLLLAYDPHVVLKRGYAIVRHEQRLLTSVSKLQPDQSISLELHDGTAEATITAVHRAKPH